MLVFLLKRRGLQFDESNEEGITNLLEAAATHPTTTGVQSLVAELGLNPPSM